MLDEDRLRGLIRFYGLLSELEARVGGKRLLRECTPKTGWPPRGVYFFFEEGQNRSDCGVGARVVRVGTHALQAKSHSTLWGRLKQHKGNSRSGGGNHRGSIFRKLVGDALLRRNRRHGIRSWNIGNNVRHAARELGTTTTCILNAELPLELEVSRRIGAMSLLWIAIDDAPGPASVRAIIEKNRIALLSNANRPAIDSPTRTWLGLSSGWDEVRRSGMWNNQHVNVPSEPGFLGMLEGHIRRM